MPRRPAKRPTTGVDTPEDAGREESAEDGGLLGRLINRATLTIVDRAPMDKVIESVDVNAFAERLDLDAIVARLDLDSIVDRLDLAAIVERLDVDAIVDRVDVDVIVQRVDMDAIVDRIDVDSISRRLDLDVLVDRLDVNAIAARMDVDQVVSRIDLAPLIGRGTQEVAESWWNFGRRQLVRADFLLDRAMDRLLQRNLTADLSTVRPRNESDHGFHHYPAGLTTRAAAFALDLWAVTGLFGSFGAVATYFWQFFFGEQPRLPGPGWVGAVTFGVWLLLYAVVPVTVFGRTLGHALLGIRVQGISTSSSSRSRPWFIAVTLAAARAVLAVVLAPLGMITSLVRGDRLMLHDALTRTRVVYDWGGRTQRRLTPPVTQARLVADSAA